MEPTVEDKQQVRAHNLSATSVKDDTEPLVDLDDVQGDPIFGFNKPYYWYICADIVDATQFKGFIKKYNPNVTSASAIADFRVKFRALRKANRGMKPAVAILKEKITANLNLFNIAFGYDGLSKLLGADVASHFDKGNSAFALGLPKRSPALGDGPRDGWKVGKDSNPHVFITIASDDKNDLDALKVQIENDLAQMGGKLLRSEEANRLSDPTGREHFGFQDGISQPGLRGHDKNGNELSKRYLDKTDPTYNDTALPGQDLVNLGEVLLGYINQDLQTAGPAGSFQPGSAPLNPSWSMNGTFLVYRRLNQDVAKLWNFIKKSAASNNMDIDLFASQMFGRWPSGASPMRTQTKDIYDMGQNPLSNNAFLYASVLTKPKLAEGTDPYPQQPSNDIFGDICPITAHLRKVNPRDSPTDLSGPTKTLGKRLVRRGTPFGPPIPDKFTDDGVERGLVFTSYQASIDQQFEFLITNWVNSPISPDSGGIDPIIGQNRYNQQFVVNDGKGTQTTVSYPQAFVTPTGGGYFFVPSISALKTVFIN